MKKKLLVAVSYVLLIALTLGATVAYFTDTDSAVNVMTVGNIDIMQIEQERDKDGKLTDFTQDKKLLPAYFTGSSIGWAPESEWVVAGDQAWKVVEKNGNVIDKFVTVKNTGKNPAYVRTLVAYEGDETYGPEGAWIHVVTNGTNVNPQIANNHVGVITVEDVKYTVYEYVYPVALAPGETSIPSLKQIYMNNMATMDVAKVYGEKYNVLVLSQAVQSELGVEVAAADALNTAFGLSEEKAAEWFGGVLAEHSADVWDGTFDATWYNDTDTEFTLTTAEQLAGFAELVDGGNTFAGKTVKVGKNLDLYAEDANGNRIQFNPIGHSANGESFNGIFDGQGNTISGMYQQSNLDSNNGGWLYEGQYYGLFAYTKGAEIKNVTIADAYVSSGRNEAACVVGNAENTIFSDITISNSTLIAYNNSAGGVAAECYGNCSFTNITVDEDTVIGPLWGTYDVRLGGVVGLVHAGNNVTFKDVTVSCKLDAINDVAANYQYWLYRYCGMLIGHVDGVNGVADPTGYVTCENVVVNYGDWVNYHYCEDADLGAGSYNGPGEYKYARVEAGTGTDGIDLNACNHNADESHNVLIVFDQLFGGGQGIKGLKTYDGVTVNYPQ
ncbi:MAG: hypothetical protein IJP27_01865 [Clostridia bacterium]|nr:hypothetical protein [Clostridia bacterium]